MTADYSEEEALQNPEAAFADPRAVLRSQFDVRTQREILRSWLYSLQQREISASEGMADKMATRTLTGRMVEVCQALDDLVAGLPDR